MKNYLLNVLSLSTLLLMILVTSCSESDSDETASEPDTENAEPDTENENTDSEVENENEDTEEELTECVFCPYYSIQQTTASNPEPVTISEPKATVCKGEDGKAYLDGVLNTDNKDYEDYLTLRQMILPCTAITN